MRSPEETAIVEEHIADQIDAWHDAGDSVDRRIYVFLGMTWDEYDAYVSRGIIPDRYYEEVLGGQEHRPNDP